MPAHPRLHSTPASTHPAAPWTRIPATGPVLRPAEAAAYLGVSLSTYYELVKTGNVPPFVKLTPGARASGVPRPWLDAAIAARAAPIP